MYLRDTLIRPRQTGPLRRAQYRLRQAQDRRRGFAPLHSPISTPVSVLSGEFRRELMERSIYAVDEGPSAAAIRTPSASIIA